MTGPQPGAIGVTSQNNWTAKAIQYGTRSRWNHTAVLERRVGDDKCVVLEANGKEFVRAMHPIDSFEWDLLMLPQVFRDNLLKTQQECLGLKYDYADIASFIWRFNKVRITGNPYPDHPDDRVICSEAVAWGFREAQRRTFGKVVWDFWPGVAAGEISPGDIEQALWHDYDKFGIKLRNF